MTTEHLTDDQRSDERLVIGCEIGSRGLRVVLADDSGDIHDTLHGINTRSHASATVDALSQLIDQLILGNNLDTECIDGIGIAFGGPVDSSRGITIDSPRNPGFEHYPLAGIIEERFSLRTIVENDARAAAVGEFRFGAGRGARTMIYLQLGIGVGGGIILEGRLHHGITMTAGELGHMPVTIDGPRCSCGRPGHLEAYVSEPAIVERMRECLSRAPEEIASEWYNQPDMTVRRIFDSRESDECAGTVAGDATRMTGLALASLVTTLNSDAVVLGGYAIDLGAEFIAAVRARIRQFAFESAARRTTVSAGQLGQNAAVIGAVVLTLEKPDDDLRSGT